MSAHTASMQPEAYLFHIANVRHVNEHIIDELVCQQYLYIQPHSQCNGNYRPPGTML